MTLDRWLRIELRHLFAIEAVAEEGSFSAAGDRLGYVQSAVSHQIAALENIVGKRLFERTRGTKPVALTAEGQILYAHAKVILARVRAAEADLSNDPSRRSLRVGSFQMISSRIVARVLHAIGDDMSVDLVERTTEVGLIDQLVEGELDAAFSEGPLTASSLDAIELFEDHYVVLAQAQSGAALAGSPLTLREAAQLPLVGHSASRPRVAQHLAVRNLNPRYVARSDVNSTIQSLVRNGACYAIVPRFSVDETDEEVTVLPLEPVDAIEPRVVLLVWNSDRAHDPAVSAFVAATVAVCRELNLATQSV